MTSLLDVRSAAAREVGDQEPRIFYAPPSVSSAGAEAVDLADQAGLHLDPWQAQFLESSLAERADGKWAAFEVGLIVPRQNGKGSILEARELAGLFLLNEKLQIHSAHLFDTSLEAFRRIMELIEGTPWLESKVKRVSKSHGEEGLELKTGQRLRFKTRTKGGGRGLTGDVVYLDEAMILPVPVVGALMPTMAARSQHGNPQLWYTGSAGNEDSHVLAAIRRRAMKGGDPSLCFAEWSVDEDAYRLDPAGVSSDPRAWRQANPGQGIRIAAEHIAREHRSMDPVEFARERLSIGTWPLDDAAGSVITHDMWAKCLAPDARLADGQAAIGLDVTPDRTTVNIAAAGMGSTGRQHVQLLEQLKGTSKVVARVLELQQKRHAVVVVDPGSPAGSLIPALEDAGCEVLQVTLRDIGQACGAFYDAVKDERVTHIGQTFLDAAVAGASTRVLSRDAWAWRPTGAASISPLVAATYALHGFALKGSLDPVLNVW